MSENGIDYFGETLPRVHPSQVEIQRWDWRFYSRSKTLLEFRGLSSVIKLRQYDHQPNDTHTRVCLFPMILWHTGCLFPVILWHTRVFIPSDTLTHSGVWYSDTLPSNHITLLNEWWDTVRHEATGLGFVCFVVVNPRVLSVNKVNFMFVFFFFVSYIFQLFPLVIYTYWFPFCFLLSLYLGLHFGLKKDWIYR